ncbi:MAG: hypothetical protein ABI091_18555, partial [Ferruginibacter sp.]
MKKTRNTIFLIFTLLFFFKGSSGQCTSDVVFKNKISIIYNSTAAIDRQLKNMLQLEIEMQTSQLQHDSSYMYLLQKIGILYFSQSNYKKAIEFTKQSIQIAIQCVQRYSHNTLSLVENYYNLQYYFEASGQMKSKYDAIDSCITYALQGSTGFDMALASIKDKVEYLFNKGEFSSCIFYSKLGEHITQKYYHKKDSLTYIVYFLTKHVNALYFSKNIPTAENILETTIRQFKTKGYPNHLYSFYNLMGFINTNKRNYTKALGYFSLAFNASSIIKYKKGCAQSLAYIGTVYATNFHKYDTGLQYCNKALKYADASDSLLIFQQEGNIYTLKKNYSKAQYFFKLAYNTVQKDMDENSMLKHSFQFPGFNQLRDLSDLTTCKGDAYVQQYYSTKNNLYIETALKIYKKNDLFLTKIKIEQHLQFASNLVWRATARSFYEHAIAACYANGNLEEAFYFFEKSRATLLNDQVNEQRWMADTDIARQSVLKKNIIDLNNKLDTISSASNQYLKIQDDLNSKNKQFTILLESIKNKNPLYYKNYLDTSFITLNQLRKNILINNKTLIEIFSGDSAIYVLTITNNNQSLHKIDKNLYDSLTKNYISSISNHNILNKHFKDFVNTSHRLYELISKDIIPGNNIIISPDGKGYPFEALVMNDNAQLPDYLLNHYVTSYTYSANYLITQPASVESSNNSILGIAPVRYNNNQNLSELSGSDQSLKIIDGYFSNAANYTFEKATKNNFLQFFPDHKIIQLYTHASDTSSENDPVIYFSDSALYLSSLIPDRKPVT